MPMITIRIERGAPREQTPRQRRRRNVGVAAVAGVSAIAAAALIGTSAHASGISPVTPTHTLQNNTAVAANKSVSPVVSGSATTVPTDATRVQVAVSLTGELSSGTLKAYPNGNPAGVGGSLAFTANTPVSTTMLVAPGMANKVIFLNQSSGSVKLTVKITGYTTDVYATDINGAGGSAGQVLTNTGAGATWQTPAASHAYGLANNFAIVGVSTTQTVVAQLAVPAGGYDVTFNATFSASTAAPDYAVCTLYSPANATVAVVYTGADSAFVQTTITAQGLVNSPTGGTISVRCSDSYSAGSMYYPTLIATAVRTTTGSAPNIVRPLQGPRATR